MTTDDRRSWVEQVMGLLARGQRARDVVVVAPSGTPFQMVVQDARAGTVDGLLSATVTGASLETADVPAASASVDGSPALLEEAGGHSGLLLAADGTQRSGRGRPGRLPL